MARTTKIEKQAKTAARIILVIVALAVATGALTLDAEGTTAEAFTASPELIADEEKAAMAARTMFEDAGFSLPEVSIRFHADSAACGGHDGLYTKAVDQAATVDICYLRQDPETGHIMRARMLWHELAHVFIEERIDEASKTSLLDLLGLEHWNSGEYTERGGEHAAEILVWGMRDGRYQPNGSAQDLACETKAAGYTTLTGLSAPTC